MTAEPLQWFRYLVLAVCGALALGGLLAMAVQRRTISPFSRTARTIRKLTDPALRPVERRLARAGRNPQAAPGWLIGMALVGGIVVVSLVQFLAEQALVASAASRGGGQSLAVLLVSWALTIVEIALIVRVIGSWVGAGRYHALMKPFVVLTEWLLAPIRRALPSYGPFDFSPLIAWLLLHFLLGPLLLGLASRIG